VTRRILEPMERRYAAVVLVLFVSGAPLALEVCRAMCIQSTPPTAAAGAMQDDSCHHGTAPNRTTVSHGAHSCGHREGRIDAQNLTAADKPLARVASLVLGASVPAFADPIVASHASARGPASAPPPGGARLVLPLRI
jgi:hypothetical protein